MTDQRHPDSASPEPGPIPGTPPTPPPPPPLAALIERQPEGDPAAGPPPSGQPPPPPPAPLTPLPTPAGWAPAGGQPTPAAPASTGLASTTGDKLRLGLILGGIVAFFAVVLFLTANNIGADDLAVGHCFDEPTETEVSTVTKTECSAPHDAEVFLAAEYAGDSSTYPDTVGFDAFVTGSCVPAFQAYVGEDYNASTTYDMGYFFPLPDGWDDGDRTITCYVVRIDGTKLTESVKVAS